MSGRGLSNEAGVLVDWLRAHARGADYAKTARQIRAALGFNDRALRALANEAAAAGVLVCAGQGGYFVPVTWDETRETVLRLRSQAVEMFDRAERIEAMAREEFAPVRRSRPSIRFTDTPEPGDLLAGL